jgi:ATP-dependent exoDNAse (exonuclease V) beta subunit
LVEILAMPVFDKLSGCTLYREREFLCQLPANQFLDTTADDGVLVQGAIDLLATGKGGTAIIDYKYSKKSDDELVSFYSAQLALYKKAVARILKINEETISTTIVNIYSRRQINLQQ